VTRVQAKKADVEAPAAYLVIANDLRPLDGKPLTAPEVFDLMMTHQCWEVTSSAPHFRKMQPGDTLVFYLGGQRRRYLAGMATVAAKPDAITNDSPATFNREEIPYFTWRLPIKRIKRFEPGALGLEVVEQLSFTTNSTVERKYIGLLLRGGVRALAPEDVALIHERSKA